MQDRYAQSSAGQTCPVVMINSAGQICTKQCRTDMPCGDDKQCTLR